ncbi:MAG: glycerophosphodiester phosphodiesterase family protein [Rudaea sp.]
MQNESAKTVSPVTQFILVAHRGDATNHVENTLAAFASAARLGLRYVELDVQVTRDGVPIVLHDVSLARIHRIAKCVTALSIDELGALGVLADGRRPPPIPRLAEFVAWMRATPTMHVFVEIKKESLAVHGRKSVLAAIAGAIESIRERAVLISYDARVLAMAKRAGFPIGYVLPSLHQRHRRTAETLAPEWLFADFQQILDAGGIWPGSWIWATFEIDSVELAQRMAGLGVDYVETMNPAKLVGATR